MNIVEIQVPVNDIAFQSVIAFRSPLHGFTQAVEIARAAGIERGRVWVHDPSRPAARGHFSNFIA